MNFSLIICTYQRPQALSRLLGSVEAQSRYPNQILIIDGSTNHKTEIMLGENNFRNLEYFKVDDRDRGLTKQRNYGISKLAENAEIVCFLDDDVVLLDDYFENLIGSYSKNPNAIGVGGVTLNGVDWKKKETSENDFKIFEFDGWTRKLGSRNILRKRLGLLSDRTPGMMPNFSHGFSTGFLPPSGKTYPVQFFMGGISSYRTNLFEKIGFSTYFEGYGLYEDMDFCLRASKIGQLYVNTAANLYHEHHEEGRPNKFKYGKMVLRNGWYVWRVGNPNPSLKARFKWHATSFLLTLVRLGNTINTKNRKEAFTESLGRIVGWWELIFNKPKFEQ